MEALRKKNLRRKEIQFWVSQIKAQRKSDHRNNDSGGVNMEKKGNCFNGEHNRVPQDTREKSICAPLLPKKNKKTKTDTREVVQWGLMGGGKKKGCLQLKKNGGDWVEGLGGRMGKVNIFCIWM